MPLVRFLFSILMLLLFAGSARSQLEIQGDQTRQLNRGVNPTGTPRGPNSKTTGGDTLSHRTGLEDSITISFRYFDSSRIRYFDSGVLNLERRFPEPYTHLYLGNLGSASHPILFTPRMNTGFDAGFHAYDLYQWKVEDTRFFQTTRPFTELNYIISSPAEQTINILHTQNIKPTWNAAFEYRFLSSPGTFKNTQNTGHSIRLSSAFVTKARRYSGFFVWVNNKHTAAQSGGILSDTMLKASAYDIDRFSIPTRIGGDPVFSTSPFGTSLSTFLQTKSTTLFFRHQYDFGQKDSVATDSGFVKVFYPRFRVQHNLSIASYANMFQDTSVYGLQTYFNYTSLTSTVLFQDKWSDIKNEFDLILFPEKENQNQFLKVGAAYQMLRGTMDNTSLRLHNAYLTGEYRNRTKNKKWDVNASGQLYLTGYNAGDYTAWVRLQAFVGQRFGDIQLEFQNTNHTPGFVYDTRSSFPLLPSNGSFNKENISHFSATVHENKFHIDLSGHYFIIANYTYFDSFYHASQAPLASVLRISAEKKFKLSKRWTLYSELHFQQSTGNVINLPSLFTRNRLAFEGNFYKNLFLATGLDVRYFTSFKADNFSPLTGQFFLQDGTTISNRPDVAAFLHFRIKSFNAFIRAENLNTFRLKPSAGFLANNMAAPLYPMQGQVLRLGIKWGFVN